MKHSLLLPLLIHTVCATVFSHSAAFAAPVKLAPYTPYQVQELVGRARSLGANMTPKDVSQLYNAANRMYKQGHALEAREILTIICNTRYVNCNTLCSLADNCIDQLGETDASRPAEKYLKRAVKLDPNCSRAWTCLADLSFKNSDIPKALKYSDKSVTVSLPKPPYHLAYMVRATILSQAKRYDEALECVRKAEKPAGYRAELYRIKGGILENLKRYDEAAAAYRIAVSKTNQNRDWMMFQIVRCLEKQNLNKEAIGELGEMIKTTPADAEPYRVRASIKVKVNDLNGAIADLSKVLELEPTTKSYLERAKLYTRIGRKDLAKQDEQAAAKLKSSPF